MNNFSKLEPEKPKRPSWHIEEYQPVFHGTREQLIAQQKQLIEILKKICDEQPTSGNQAELEAAERELIRLQGE